MTRNPDQHDLTALVNGGSTTGYAAREFWADRHPELRQLAGKLLTSEGPNHSLEPTALVHEAFVRMIDRERVTDEGTAFFKSCFATECRRVLVDHARARRAAKRGGGVARHSLSGAATGLGVDQVEIVDLHEAIEALGQQDESVAQVVDMRIFGAMTTEECALTLGCSKSTVERQWRFARSWLMAQVTGDRTQ